MTEHAEPPTPDPDTAGPQTPDVPAPRGPIGNGTADRRLAIEERRQEVAVLVLAHVPYRTIASMLGIGRSTVADDVKVIREQWRTRAAATYGEHVAEEVAKLDTLERSWIGLAIPPDNATPEQVTAAAQAALVLDRIGRQRARLLGLNAPVRQEVMFPQAGGPVAESSAAEKVQRALRLVREVEAVEADAAAAIDAESRVVAEEAG